MPIKVGDKLPEAKFRVMTAEGPAWKTTDEIFKGKKVALFAVPGAFTGDLPQDARALHRAERRRDQGQGRRHHRGDGGQRRVRHGCLEEGDRRRRQVDFLADGNGEFAKAIDLPSTAPATGSARARSATPCWSRTAW